MRAVLALLLLGLALAAAQWEGTWLSDYGSPTLKQAPWYICVVPTGTGGAKFYATYSRVGTRRCRALRRHALRYFWIRRC